MTSESERIVEEVDRFPLEVREYLLKAIELLANDFLEQGVGVPDQRAVARAQHRQRLSEGNKRRWARWRAERGIPEPVRSNVLQLFKGQL